LIQEFHFGASVFWTKRSGAIGGQQDRIAWFQHQVAHLRRTEVNPVNYRAAASGFLAEIDRMQLEVRDYFCFLPTQSGGTAEPAAAADGGHVIGVSCEVNMRPPASAPRQ
jgi:hypothetical protein